MSFKRFDPEDIVLSSEIVTTPTWYTQEDGDTAEINPSVSLVESGEAGESADYYLDLYSRYNGVFDFDHSKRMMSLALAEERDSGSVAEPTVENIIFGQYRSLVLGDEDSEFRFGDTRVGSTGDAPACKHFFAISIDRARFREKIDPNTCEIDVTPAGGNPITLAPDITANERYIDAGRVFDLAQKIVTGSAENPEVKYVYPVGTGATSFGYFLPDIGVLLLNAEKLTLGDETEFTAISDLLDPQYTGDPRKGLQGLLTRFVLRSQETITSNYVFARARNAEFNYSTNPSNIAGEGGNIRWNVMINQPQSFVTTIGLYNDSNELLAVAKLSKPLVKDFTREALIRLKLDY